jgi:hypothetical protein
MPKYRYSLVACARWEEDDIQEWVAYHRSIGFDHIWLYSNDDDPDRLFRAVAPWVIGPNPFITFRHWPAVGAQMDIYLHFLETWKSETEWFSFLDIDEFFVLTGVNNIATFMRAYTDRVDCLYFHWLNYGNCGRLSRTPGSTLLSYVRRAAGLNHHTKHLCRSAAVDAAEIRRGYLSGYGAFHHFLDNYRLDGLRCSDVLHTPTDGYSSNFPDSALPFVRQAGFTEAAIGRGYIAHYQFRSEADFLRRWRRGGFPNGEMMRQLYDDGVYRSILDSNNAVYDSGLAGYWWRYTAPAMQFSLEPPYRPVAYANVAHLKPTLQSSIYDPAGHPEPPRSRVAGGANTGMRTGTYGFHTQFEAGPWWSVDLLSPHRVSEIHIYNRLDNASVAGRSARLQVQVRIDDEDWAMLMERDSDEPFGLDGAPLIIAVNGQEPFRFIRLSLPMANYLHLDEIEVYGEPVA